MGRKQKDSLKNILSSYGFPCFHKEEYSHSYYNDSQYAVKEPRSAAAYIPDDCLGIACGEEPVPVQ